MPTRGSALILTLLVVLVLTVIGLGVAYFTQIEEKIAGNDQVARVGFYAAEAGLRYGESAISTAIGPTGPGGVTLNSLLNTGGATYAPPGGGRTAYELVITGQPSFANIDVLTGQPAQGSFTLYVRNNKEDKGGLQLDTDNAITLISVGTGPNGIERVLEERIDLSNPGQTSTGNQSGSDSGGSGSIAN